MRKSKFLSYVLAASMLLSSTSAVAVKADNDTNTGASDYSWTESMNRGVVAVPISGGVYLSWRLQADEDNRFGSASENVSFDIYRDGVKIAEESNKLY